MHKKTQLSQFSTKYTENDIPTSSSSYILNRKRDMFQTLNQRNTQNVDMKQIIEQNGSKLVPKNVLLMNPAYSRSITWPQVFIPDEECQVSLKGNFYTIRDSRNKQKFIERKSMPNSETVYLNVQKMNDSLIICSVEKYFQPNERGMNETWHHVDLVIWEMQEDEIQRRWAFERFKNKVTSGISLRNLQSQKKGDNHNNEIETFKSIQLIDNFKKALIVFDSVSPSQPNEHRYELLYIDFFHNNNKQDHHQPSKFISSSNTLNALSIKEINYQKNSKIVGRSTLQGLQSQTMVNLINSEFGDITLLVTSEDIYELEINSRGIKNQHSLILKPVDVNRMLLQNKNTYISNNNIANFKQSFALKQIIIDAKYIPNSLKVLILTTHGRIMVIQSQQCMFTESLYEILSPKDVMQLYNIEFFVFKNIHFLNGQLIVSVQAQKQEECNLLKQIHYEESILNKIEEKKDTIEYVSRGLVIVKLQSNTVSLNKFISLPFDLKSYPFIKIHDYQDIDQILIQTINVKKPSVIQLYKCQIISNKNTFLPFSTQHLLQNYPQKTISTKNDSIDNKSLSRVTFGKSQRVFYLLRDNEVSCYKIETSEFSNIQQGGMKKKFTTSFFQKPTKVIVNPLTGQVVILFRQFVKIFSNIYTNLKLVNSINIRDVKDIIFSKLGQNMIFAMNDDTIHLVDSYTLRSKKIMDFQGEIKDILYPSESLLSVRSSKNVLSIFTKKAVPQYDSKTETLVFYDKLYEIKIYANDLYFMDETTTIVLKKQGTVYVYSHIPQKRQKLPNSDDNEKLRYEILKEEHPHLLNRKKIEFRENDSPSYVFYSSQFSSLFLGTKFGYIYQLLCPFSGIEDQSPPQSYQYQIFNTEILHIEISADFQSLYVVSEIGEVIQLKLQQYLNGSKKNGIYVVSKGQNPNENVVKYQFANRTYLMDNFSTINSQVSQAIEQHYEQTCFVDDKIKNDIEDITSKIKYQSHHEINKLSSEKKSSQTKFKSQFGEIITEMKEQQKTAAQKLHQMCEHNQNIKQEMISNYEKELLSIYKENDRLQNIMNNKIKQYTQQTIELKQKMQLMIVEQQRIKQIQLQNLQNSYKSLGNQYGLFQQVANQQIDENKNQLQQILNEEMKKYTEKLQIEEKQKQAKLSQLGKIQKEIERYKKRSIYFENLIVQTRNQLQQLTYDIDIYQQKKSALIKELSSKQQTIELKQSQIISHLKKTTEMKKIKNIHQFELQSFQAEIIPVQNKITELQQKVQQINHQIMLQFNSKVQQTSLIENSQNRIKKLTQKNRTATENLLHSKTKLLRFTESLSEILAQDPFANDVRKKLSKVIDTFSARKIEQKIPNLALEKQKKYSENLVKRKNMLLKSIERQQKIQQGVIKNKNQFFKFYSDNTNLVKQYNHLFKDHNILMNQKIQLQNKLNALKQQNHKTPVKKTTSLHSLKKPSGPKLTPFQRYEQEHVQLTSLKLRERDTTETRNSRGQSSTFLKSLIKDVSVAQSRFEKSNLIRGRIRTFVNPEIQRQKQIQRQLFQREKGKSSYMPALKL